MKKNPKRAAKVAASLILHRPSAYSASGLRAITLWAKRILRDVARYRTTGKLGPRFTARYYYG